jgi:hypothetical protein
LKKALNRGSDFVGVVAVRTAHGISTITAEVISHTTKRMQEGFFTWRQEIPPYYFFSKKIVYSKPSNYGLKKYCVALSGPPLGLNDYSLAPPTRRLQNKKQNSQ